MGSNQYRNKRNSYRKKRRNEHRGLVALVTVTIMGRPGPGAWSASCQPVPQDRGDRLDLGEEAVLVVGVEIGRAHV